MTSTTVSTAERIRALNDAFRRTFVGGMVMITAGVEAMPVDQRRSLLRRCAPSTPSPTTTIPTANTTSARSTRAASAASGRSTCMRRRRSSVISLPSPFLLRRCHVVDVDLGAFGRGHALQRIDLYPVRAKALSSHNRYSRLPKARKRRWRTKLLLGRERPSIFPVANRLAAGAASSMIPYQPLSVAPSGMMPSSTKRHNAIASFRASATMPTLRPRMPLEPKRSRHHSESLLSG